MSLFLSLGSPRITFFCLAFRQEELYALVQLLFKWKIWHLYFWTSSMDMWKSLIYVWLFATPWTIQSMEFSRPEYWRGWPFPSPTSIDIAWLLDFQRSFKILYLWVYNCDSNYISSSCWVVLKPSIISFSSQNNPVGKYYR